MAYFNGQQNSWSPYSNPQVSGGVFNHTQQAVNGLVRVTGIEGAKAYQLPPNSSMPLFDGNDDIMYVKTTDGAGFPTIRSFRFEPIVEQMPDTQQGTIFATKQDFEELKGMIQNVQQSISARQSNRKQYSKQNTGNQGNVTRQSSADVRQSDTN